MAQKTGRMNWIALLYAVLLVISLAVLGVGLAGWLQAEDEEAALLAAAGPVASVLCLTLAPVALLLRRLVAGRKSSMQHTLDDMLTVMRSLNDRASLSDAAKRVVWRHRDLEAVRQAIQEDIQAGNLITALALTHLLEQLHGARQEAAQLRDQVVQARAAQLEKEVVDAVGGFEQLLESRQWDRAQAEAQRIQRAFPDAPRATNLTRRAVEARAQYKQDLERRFLDASHRDDVETAMELLKELDQYLTEKEAAPLTEIARGVIGKKRQNLGVQFKLAIHDNEDVRAMAIGEEIIRDFPNTKMAEEVRQVMPLLRERAGRQRADYAAGEPVA